MENELPFKMLLVGHAATGKTSYLLPIAAKSDVPGVNIFIVCPSVHHDPRWRLLILCKMIPPDNIYTVFNDSEMETLFNRLMLNPEKRSLLILDCNPPLKSPVFFKIASTCRCHNISLIATYQKLKKPYPVIEQFQSVKFFSHKKNFD